MLTVGLAQAAELKVVASIKPVHALAAAIMKDVGKPDLIIDGPGTPHSYALKPSKARLLAKADLIFWIGPALETFLQKPVQTIGVKAQSIELASVDGLVRRNIRQIDNIKATSTDSQIDPHIWLDPQNARVMALNIAKALINKDPENADKYQANLQNLLAKLGALTREVLARLTPVKNQPFITYHDGYQYFEARFDLKSSGVLIVDPEIKPGARHIQEINNKLKQSGKICLFSEPQFSQKTLETIAENSQAKIALLDPLGSNIAPGPGHYLLLIKAMATAFADCLSSLDE